MSHDHGHPPLRSGSDPTPPPLASTARIASPNDPPGVWDDPRNVSRLLSVFYALCIALVGIDLVIHRHIGHPWERLFGFHAWYGFVACWLLVVIAKAMRRVIMRPEDYYDVD
jgi:hypothetical protein